MKKISNEEAKALGLIPNEELVSTDTFSSSGRKVSDEEAVSLGLLSPEDARAIQYENEYQESMNNRAPTGVIANTVAPVGEGVVRGAGELIRTIDDIGSNLYGEDTWVNELHTSAIQGADHIQSNYVADNAWADFVGDASQFATGFASTPIRGIGLGANLARGAIADSAAFSPEEILISDVVTDVDNPWLRRGTRALEGGVFGLAGEGVVRGVNALRESRASRIGTDANGIRAYEQSSIGQSQSRNTDDLLRVNTAREALSGADSILERIRVDKEFSYPEEAKDYREQMVLDEYQRENVLESFPSRNPVTGEVLDEASFDIDNNYLANDGNYYPKPTREDISNIRQRFYREALDSADTLPNQSIMNLSMGSRQSNPRNEGAFTLPQQAVNVATQRPDGSPRIAPSLTGLNPEMRQAIGMGQGQHRLLQVLEYAERALPFDAINFVRGRNLDNMISSNRGEVIGRINQELDRLEQSDWNKTIQGREDRRIHKALTNIKHKFENDQALDASDTDALKAGGVGVGSISSFRDATTGELTQDYESTSIANRVMGHSRLLSGLKGSQGVSKLAQGASLILPFMTSGVSIPVSAFSSVVKSTLERRLYDKVRGTAAYGRFIFKEAQADEWLKNGAINAREHSQYINDAHEALEVEIDAETKGSGMFSEVVIEALNDMPVIIQSMEAATRLQLAEAEEDE
ncbi:hypothetical protein BCU90_17365 [Vibrio lentus]|uniref:hypothetical protein n=1 Tax=Vibrio lentus TaxID=136468 RepID=UPI000C82D704|nr:hypothetical protein [Vibrio lentus]PMG45633.1 hypothetical protein BCU90_17365 [Vibrio lentus]